MSKRGVGVIMNGAKNDPVITGYLIIDNVHFEIYGHRVSSMRTELHIRETMDDLEEKASDARRV